ncbi:Cell division protein FtsZ [Paramagnetospirillum magnetotacticum MS-1]|uniref:Cell division protein FtsZ n=1 Tax=Paramagnetospirillum magnetotacticum MS-1 TaxID=272627 RepID=A0A0C2U5T1_PARME|nr:cell division protein FtsZ [Paramagnetospirillum magnetotacticum]KIL96807.1 Cell division protein FtsZ [Paramagnetospirillum magnetotacticum MS-1]
MLTFLPGAHQELKPRITVVGVGGAGGNAVNNMILSRLEGVEFIVANTDSQSLGQSRTERRIQLGNQVTQGLGAGSRPDIGRAAAEESLEEILGQIGGANMVFITAGMGGGTGSGAAPVIARAAREQGILTVGVVTKPFHFEGAHRMRTAESAIEELQQFVDTLIIIPNQNLFRVATERTTFADAFKMADDVLYSGVRGVTDLMIMPGLINLDFADIRTVMSEMGKAMMGTGEAEGDKRAIDAAEAAISNPLLDDTSMKGARGVLINITGGMDMTLFEVDEAANRIRDEVDPDANIIFGSTFDEKLNGKMRVSVVATGIASEAAAQGKPTVISLVTPTAPPAPAPAARPAAAATQAPFFRPQAAAQPAVARTPVSAPVSAPAAVAHSAPQPAQRSATAAQLQPELDIGRPEPVVRHEPVMRSEPVIRTEAPARAEIRPEPELRLEPEIHVESDMRAEAEMDTRHEPVLGRAPADMRVQHEMKDLHKALSDISETPTAPVLAPQPPQETRRMGGLLDRLVNRNRAPAQPAPQPQPQPQPRMEARREPTASRAGEDLDIPAFLRRQAN